ncbi:hypothetical protein ACQ4PT_052969 [Festuca glaucescens]
MEPPPPPGIRVRLWMDDPPAYVTDPLLGPNLFSVEVSHQGSFFGFGANLEYLNDSISVFDNLLIDEWSNAKVDEILSYLECRRDEKVHVYWMYPGKSLYEGLMPLVTEAHCIEMRRATALDKSLAIFVDHSNWVRIIRSDIILTRPAFAVHEPVAARQARTDGWDDDLFLDNVDIDVNDNNERIPIDDNEDEAALDDTDLNLQQGERDLLLAKMNAFNPEVDMDRPILKRGLQFANIEEARQALNAYIVRERVKIRRIKNDRTRLHAVCDFIQEFRDNQKMDLTTFATKVQREYHILPDRWKLGRARKAALLEIHGNEEAQFAQLREYGEELKRSNPGSTFFLSTNKVPVPGTDEVKEHLATMYWSYDACKRGFLAGCRPLICVDGCHIKTRYKGVLLTAVAIDPNDCIFPIAMGMVEVECKSAWEWFLQTLKDDLNITNTSHWTIMSDRQKGLILAVEKVFPEAEHRFCVRHLIQNFQKAGHRGETLKNNLWAIARSTSIPKWEKSMEKMNADSKEAYMWVEALDPKSWIKAFFSDFCKCDMLLNNHSEVFNSYILPCRENPVLSMLEMLFYKAMNRNLSKQRDGAKWHGRICPKIKKKLDKLEEWSLNCIVSPGGDHKFSVLAHELERSYCVNLSLGKKLVKGKIVFTKAGGQIHCSICGRPGHNKKGHMKFMQSLAEDQQNGIIGEDQDFDMPEILQNLFPQTPDERLDPSVRHDHMVYMMRQEAAAHAPFDVVQEPLPESQFVVAARESMPQGAARMTTATTEGRARMADSARGRGRAGRSAETARGRGRAGISAETARGRGRGRTLGPAKSTRNVGKKRAADASTSGTASQNDDAATGNIQRTGYRTGHGSVYYMLFGDDRQPSSVPDLNDQCNEDMNIGEEPLDFNNFLSL